MSQWKIDVKDLVFKTRVGKGNFGEVYDGDYLGTRVAIKKLYFVNDEMMQKYIEREMDTLTNLAHPNIVQFMGLCIELEDIYIVTEFVPGGDLRAILKDDHADIPWDVRVDIAKQLAAAMNYLHSRNIIHRDLKSHNLLVGDGWKIKVCDFGLARPVDKQGKKEETQLMTIVGTNEWMAPEVMLGLEYDHKCDVFSYAMVLYELITRDKPPQRVVRDQFGFPDMEHKSSIPSETPEELWNLLVECAERDAQNRPEFKDVIRKITVIQQKYSEEGWPAVPGAGKKTAAPRGTVKPSSTEHHNGEKKHTTTTTTKKEDPPKKTTKTTKKKSPADDGHKKKPTKKTAEKKKTGETTKKKTTKKKSADSGKKIVKKKVKETTL